MLVVNVCCLVNEDVRKGSHKMLWHKAAGPLSLCLQRSLLHMCMPTLLKAGLCRHLGPAWWPSSMATASSADAVPLKIAFFQ